MPRDLSGNYVLPTGNPVVGGTIIESDWANPTMADIGNELGDSLSRTGKGGMLAPFRFASGSEGNPSQTFVIDTATGRYLASSQDMRDVVGGVDTVRYRVNGVDMLLDLGVNGTATFDGNVILSLEPTDPLHATSKEYVDSLVVDGYIPIDEDSEVIANTEWQDLFAAQFGNDANLKIYYDSGEAVLELSGADLVIKDGASTRVTVYEATGDIEATGAIEAQGGVDKVTDQNGGTLKNWSGTQAQYDALTPDANTLYFIEEP